MALPVFPTLPGLSFPITKSPVLNTIRYEAFSGRRTYAPKQSFPRWRFEIPYSFLRSAKFGPVDSAYTELETLLQFFLQRSADGLVFAYTDSEEYAVTAQLFGTGDAAATQFQLYRSISGFTEPVYSATVSNIYLDGVDYDSSHWTVSDTGLVTFDGAIGAGVLLTWTGTYAFACRFDNDSLDLERFMRGLTQTSKSLAFSSELAL